MHKGQLLNATLQQAIATMGHTDSLTICDAGLPIPTTAQRIDLALCRDVPSFIDTFKVILTTLFVERVVLAQEITDKNPKLYQELVKLLQALEQSQGNHITIDMVKHEEFKMLTHSSKAIVRSGECSPYANIILYSGVVF